MGKRLWMYDFIRNAVVGAVIGACAAFFVPLLTHTKGALVGAFILASVGVYRNITSKGTALSIHDKTPRNLRGVADELLKFAELRDKGVITDDEFQVRKKKLLEY
jgi:hypothetical protein